MKLIYFIATCLQAIVSNQSEYKNTIHGISCVLFLLKFCILEVKYQGISSHYFNERLERATDFTITWYRAAEQDSNAFLETH